MKILIIRNYPSYMRISNGTYNIQEVGLAKALVRKGHQCDVLFWTNGKEEVVEVPVDCVGIVRVYYRRGYSILKNAVYLGCRKLFDEYDILQPSEYNQIQSWLLAGKYPRKTVIYHGPYYCAFNKRYNLMCKLFDALFLRRYIKRGTKFLAKSSLAKEFLLQKGIRSENIEVVGVGMDSQMLTSVNNSCDSPLYHRMCADVGLKLLYIGRLEPRRNIPFLLSVFRRVLEKNPEATLYIIGTGDLKYKEMVVSLIDEFQLRDRVCWQDKLEQKYLSKIYKMADFFLLPTQYEIFGMVLLEAMYYGKVVLTTYNGGSSMLVQNGENGFVLDNLDDKAWADCIGDLYSNTVTMKSVGEHATATVSERYIWDSLTEQFVEQYEAKKEEKPRGRLC